MTEQTTESGAITPWRIVLDQHVEDLSSPGTCSCGWELWDGTVDECRDAYRNHVSAYLVESLERAHDLSERVRAHFQQPRTRPGQTTPDRPRPTLPDPGRRP